MMKLYHIGQIDVLTTGAEGLHCVVAEDAEKMYQYYTGKHLKKHKENHLYEIIIDDSCMLESIPGDICFWGGETLNAMLLGQQPLTLGFDDNGCDVIEKEFHPSFHYEGVDNPCNKRFFESNAEAEAADAAYTAAIATALAKTHIDGFRYENHYETVVDKSIVIYNINKVISVNKIE